MKSENNVLGRKVDNMDQRLNKHESGQRAILEQMMKMQQDFKVQGVPI